ncbi:MAG: hypothetical protein ACPG6B_01660 [Oceanihabitans sp.]
MKPIKKRILIFSVIVLLILSIPAIAMQFTDEVQWNFGDFVIAAILLLGTGVLLEIAAKVFKTKTLKVTASIGVIVLLILIWAELAVGIF